MSKTPVRKKHFGDRKDAWRVRKVDAFHTIFPMLYKGRTNNEVYLKERIDLKNILPYLEEKNKNATESGRSYSVFHTIVAALVKAIYHRPLMNRFVRGSYFWDRKELSVAFVVKKALKDNSDETVAYLCFDEDSTIEDVHKKILEKVSSIRKDENGTNAFTFLDKVVRFVPHILIEWICNLLLFLDYHGRAPNFIMKDDPAYCSVLISNLGSIKLDAGHHHLSKRGTNSFFVTLGKVYKEMIYDKDGVGTLHTLIDIGFTIDERIADGLYFSNSIRLLKYLCSNPKLLEEPAKGNVPYSDRKRFEESWD